MNFRVSFQGHKITVHGTNEENALLKAVGRFSKYQIYQKRALRDYCAFKKLVLSKAKQEREASCL